MADPFDSSTLAEIAELICGDTAPLRYRKGYEIPQFLERAGCEYVPQYDGSPRHAWTLNVLRDLHEDDPADIERVVLRLADPREYGGEDHERKATLERLNKVLALDGRRVEYTKGRPVLVAHEATIDDGGTPLPRVELKVAVTDVVDDPDLARAAQLRLDEAKIAYDNGAYMATIILLGSLLEGVLLHAARTRQGTKPLRGRPDKLGLGELVDVAHQNGWIEFDAKTASHLVRHYRNMVHPLAEVRTNHAPNRDTADICWPVVNAVLNDLAATAPHTKEE